MIPGGFTAFGDKYPQLCVGSDSNTQSTILGLKYLQIRSTCSGSGGIHDAASGTTGGGDLPSPVGASPFPVEVLPNLYLGNARNSADLENLYKNGIKYILNVTPNVPNKFEKNEHFRYMQIPISDHWSQNMTNYFPEAITFIGERFNCSHFC